MFGSDASIATSLILDGTDADNDFLPSDKIIEDVKKQYFVDYDISIKDGVIENRDELVEKLVKMDQLL